MAGTVCPFHADEWSVGVRQQDGSYAHVCELRKGHPLDVPWHWLEVPAPPEGSGLTGLAEELNLEVELLAALTALGDGWFEYGLVERSYATRRPQDWARMVEQWGHTAISARKYSASSYLAGALGRLAQLGSVAYHSGRGTGRWSYNSTISWWSVVPPDSWEQRTAWVAVIGDADHAAQQADVECRSYVPAG